MPHLTLEYSTNIGRPRGLSALFTALHGLLTETGNIKSGNCKSRAYPSADFLVGHGQPHDAFVHLDIRFLEGRPVDVKQAIGQRALTLLQEHFDPDGDNTDLQLTVEVRDIARATYFKLPAGTLSPL